jgi:hypothetical protein
VSWLKRLACRVGLHPTAPAEYGTWPFPLSYLCPWCGRTVTDEGPA